MRRISLLLVSLIVLTIYHWYYFDRERSGSRQHNADRISWWKAADCDCHCT